MTRYTDTRTCSRIWCLDFEWIGQGAAASRRLGDRLIVLGRPGGRSFSGYHLNWDTANRVHGSSRHLGWR